jgi:hypothetical protein
LTEVANASSPNFTRWIIAVPGRKSLSNLLLILPAFAIMGAISIAATWLLQQWQTLRRRQRASRRVGAGSDHVADHPNYDRIGWARPPLWNTSDPQTDHGSKSTLASLPGLA